MPDGTPEMASDRLAPAGGNGLRAGLLSVSELLADPSLEIPPYQRPYKWTGKNVWQFFSDIAAHAHKSAYRLGTIVFHEEGSRRNIVDGQQRTITLLMAARALVQRCRRKRLDRSDLQAQLDGLAQVMVNPRFRSEISQKNIHANYLEVLRIVSREDFTEDHIDFLLNKCEVVAVAIDDVSEAFQFFDSQNARGRDLEPHDLLKAFHLREFSPQDEPLKAAAVARWEGSETKELATLFSQYLYRIRNWSRGESARYFSKDDSYLFKGVNIDTVASFPFVEQLRIAHHFVDQYNAQYERNIDQRKLEFPFHLDQIVVNGRRFFEMVSHYQGEVRRINATSWDGREHGAAGPLDSRARLIMQTLNTYPARSRTGDRYVRTMFDCLLICYIDKFGHLELSRAVEKAFIWAYTLRLQMEVVQMASMDNHALDNNLFKLIKDAARPADFINESLPVVGAVRSTKSGAIEALFREMNYCE